MDLPCALDDVIYARGSQVKVPFPKVSETESFLVRGLAYVGVEDG